MMRINVSKMSPKTFKKSKIRHNMEKKYTIHSALKIN